MYQKERKRNQKTRVNNMYCNKWLLFLMNFRRQRKQGRKLVSIQMIERMLHFIHFLYTSFLLNTFYFA